MLESSRTLPGQSLAESSKLKFMSGLLNMKEIYGNFFSWFYEYCCAPAVVPAGEPLLTAMIAEDRQGVPPGSRVLDVGSGGGQHALRVALQRPDISVLGMDNSPYQVEVARRRAAPAGCKNLSFMRGDATALNFPDNTFDVAWSIGVVKQLQDPGSFFKEMHRVVKPGGKVMILEVDHHATIEASRAWARRTRSPRLLRPLVHWWFRKVVMGQSASRDQAQAWLDEVPWCNKEDAIPVPGCHPGWVVFGTK